jgi:hypothetical protein
MTQSSLLAFGDILHIKQQVPHYLSHKEELTVKIPSEARVSASEEGTKRELVKLRKLRDQYLRVKRTSTNPRELIFALKFVESLEQQIERMEREVSE